MEIEPAGTGPKRPRVSGIITCYNAESHIGPCIESLSWCDEIIVVDSHSTDRTAQIARAHDKVRLFQRSYYGAAAQKNWAIEKVENDWIMLLDVDERCNPALQREIESLLASAPNHDAYTISRNAYILGRRVRYSGWQHDRVVRLFRRGRAYYQRRRVHAKIVTDGLAPLLRNPMDHFMVDSLDEYIRRISKYGYWGAAQLWREGQRSNWIEILFRSFYRFVRTYLLQLGFLDGTTGLVFCMLQAYGTYIKWSVLWGWQVNEARGIPPVLPEFDDGDGVWDGLRRVEAKTPMSGG